RRGAAGVADRYFANLPGRPLSDRRAWRICDRRCLSGRGFLSKNAGVPERIASGLGIDAEPVGTFAYRNAGEQFAALRIEGVYLFAVAPGKPEHFAVGGNAAHI